jgi:hypothetical protein
MSLLNCFEIESRKSENFESTEISESAQLDPN